MKRRHFRGEAAFANPELHEFLKAKGFKYTIRLPINSVLQDRVAWLLRRPVGRPPHEVRRYYASFRYQYQAPERMTHAHLPLLRHGRACPGHDEEQAAER